MQRFVIAAALVLLPAAALADAKTNTDASATPTAAASTLPADVAAYVTTHASTPLNYTGKVLIGHGLDGEVVYEQIPGNNAYRWTNLNGQKVVVETRTKHVVAVY